MDFVERHYTSQDGLNLYFRDYPAPNAASYRPTILCLPGLTRNSKDFHKPALRLQSQGYRLICPDYRGRGQSARDPNPMNYRPETYIGDLRHLLCVLNLHKVAVIGTSMGGILAMAMGAAMPTTLRAVVLNDVGWTIPISSVLPIIKGMKSSRPFDTWQEAVDIMRTSFPDLPADTDEEWLELVESSFIEGPDGKIHGDWDKNMLKPLIKSPLEDADFKPFFRSLGSVPVGVLRGALSDLMPQSVLDDMKSFRPDLVTAVVPNVGHPPNLREQQAKEVIDAVLARI